MNSRRLGKSFTLATAARTEVQPRRRFGTPAEKKKKEEKKGYFAHIRSHSQSNAFFSPPSPSLVIHEIREAPKECNHAGVNVQHVPDSFPLGCEN